MTTFFRQFFLLLIICCLAHVAKASHYLGYDASYEYISADKYRVHVALYIDCAHGDPASIAQDAPLIFSIYKLPSLAGIVRGVEVGILRRSNLSAAPLTGCVQDTEMHCIQKSEFVYDITLSGDSFLFVNQRCCMAYDIANMLRTSEHGLTIALRMMRANNSAVFTTAPPVRFCTNTHFIIDNSATDKDGDSLAYRLVPAYDGGNGNDAKPMGDPPPYNLLGFIPPASYDLPLGTSGTFNLNATTGKITGICHKAGLYQASIACDEYRNGQRINTVTRTYSYELTDCNRGATALVAIDSMITLAGIEDSLLAVQCNGRTVKFNNISTGATSYDWDFGDPTTTGDVSTLTSPEYTYPSNGTYRVRLIAVGQSCSDTLYGMVIIGDDLVEPAFTLSGPFCSENPILLTDHSVITKGTIVSHTWYSGQQLLQGDPATIYFSGPGNHPITHYVTTAQGCIFPVTQNVDIRSPLIRTGNDTVVVQGTQLQLYATGASAYTWGVLGVNNLNATNIANPVANLANTGYSTFTVSGTDNGGCTGTDSMHVTVSARSYVFLPTAFSPNGDSHNDLLKPHLSGGNFQEFRVYNRYGREIFSTTDPNAGWDGTYKGKEQDAGVYFWLVKIKDAPTLNGVYKGEVTLVR